MPLDVSPAIDGDAAAEALAPHLPGLERCTPRHVEYKPGHDCHVLYDLVLDGACTAGHLTMLRPRRAAAGVATPTPLEYRPDLRMTVHAEAPGTRLAEKSGADLEAWMEPVEEALGRLQAPSIPELPAFSVEGEVIHGSFHDDRVLVGPAGVILLDLDSAALGHPLLDVAHFASYLSAAGEHTARSRLLDACNAGPEALLFEPAALLRWSSLPFRSLELDWPDAMEQRLLLADQWPVAYTRRCRRRNMSAC